jgi:hypothetical protein
VRQSAVADAAAADGKSHVCAIQSSRFAHWCDLATKGRADTDEDGVDGQHFNALPEDFSTTNSGSDAGAF